MSLTNIFSRKTLVLVAILPMLFAISCKPSEEKTSPKMAKSMLKLQGYDYSKAEFFRALKSENRLIVNGFFEAGIDPDVKNRKR